MTKIFTVTYFVEPIVRSFVFRYLNNYVRLFVIRQHDFIRHYLFAKIFAKLFLQNNSYPRCVMQYLNNKEAYLSSGVVQEEAVFVQLAQVTNFIN